MKTEITSECNVCVSNILQFVPFGVDLQELHGSQQKNVVWLSYYKPHRLTIR